MTLNSSSKDSEASNVPETLRASRTLQIHSHGILMLEKLLLDLKKTTVMEVKPDTGSQM